MNTPSPRQPLVILASCVFAAVCTEMLPVGLLPEVARGLGVTPAAAGLLVSIYAILVAVGSVPIAAVTERFPRHAVLAALLGTYAISNLLLATAPDYGVAFVARVIGGVAHAGFFTVCVAAADSLVDAAHSGRAIAVVMAGNALALVLGVPIGSLIGAKLGWRWVFAALALIMIALAALVVRRLPRDREGRSGPRTPVVAAVRRPALLSLSAVVILFALGHFTLYTYVTALLQHDGISRSDIGPSLFVYGAGGVIGLVVASIVVSRRPERALALNCALMVMSLLLTAVVTSSEGIVWLLLVWGAAFGAFPTLSQTVMLRAARDAPDTATALVNASTNAGISGGALLGALLLGSFSPLALGWVGAGLATMSLGLFAARSRPATN